MNKDLERTIAELGPGYGELVAKLRSAYESDDAASVLPREALSRRFSLRSIVAACGAALAAACVAAAFLSGRFPPSYPAQSYSAVLKGDYALAYSGDVELLVRTQNADGSWANDFLTRQNAAALRGVGGAGVAYRRAVRYLRAKGLAPLSDAELRERGAFAAHCAAHG